MIPQADILAWRQQHPWATNAQVEQDLIISRAMAEIFGNQALADQLAMRGGTALHKLYLNPPSRYSEDIDLVQTMAAPIGSTLDDLRHCLDPWLGTPVREQKSNAVKLVYRTMSEYAPVLVLKLKIEINTREHASVHDYILRSFAVDSRWFSAAVMIRTFTLEELLATKLRALYQRRKGRDLFDLWLGLQQHSIRPGEIARMFHAYLGEEHNHVDGEVLTSNLEKKMGHPGFLSDMDPLLRPGITYDAEVACRSVREKLLVFV